MSEKSENRINKNNSLYDEFRSILTLFNKIWTIISDKLRSNRIIIFVFVILGLLLAVFGFDLDKDSYNSLFSTMATITLALVGFIGIFFVLLLQHNRDMILYYFADVNRLAGKLTEAYVSIYEPNTQKINTVLDEIKEKIEMLDKEKKVLNESDSTENVKKAIGHKVEDSKTLNEIKYILEELILKRIKLEHDFEHYKKSFLFAIPSIFLFMIPIALNHINFLSDNYIMKFEYWSLVKMFFTGFLFGLFFIILKDSAIILNEIFDRLDILKHYPKGG